MRVLGIVVCEYVCVCVKEEWCVFDIAMYAFVCCVICKTATITHSCAPPSISRCCGKFEQTFCSLAVALASDKQFAHPHTS